MGSGWTQFGKSRLVSVAERVQDTLLPAAVDTSLYEIQQDSLRAADSRRATNDVRDPQTCPSSQWL